jgi:hypothetical protein
MSFLDEQKIRIHRRVPAAQAALVIMLYIGLLDGGRVAAITHGSSIVKTRLKTSALFCSSSDPTTSASPEGTVAG